MKILNKSNSYDLFFLHKDRCIIFVKNYLKVFQDVIQTLNIDGKDKILEFLSNVVTDKIILP